jgi:hypothetical protein
MAERLWLGFVKLFGGLHGYGWSPLCVGIVDSGVFIAWRRVIKWERRWFCRTPPASGRG